MLGVTFATGEHAFQALKAKRLDQMLWVAEAISPKQAKYRGRQVSLHPDWEEKKLMVMLQIIEGKFRFPERQQLLIDTYPHMLVEGNYWHDQYWGNCLCDNHKDIPGKNYLGKILMFYRKTCQADLNK